MLYPFFPAIHFSKALWELFAVPTFVNISLFHRIWCFHTNTVEKKTTMRTLRLSVHSQLPSLSKARSRLDRATAITTATSPTMTTMVSSVSLSVQCRCIRIHEASDNIRNFWRRDNQDIRMKNKGVPLGSAEVTTKQFEEMTQMLNQSGQDMDNVRLFKAILWFLLVCFGLQYLVETFALTYEPQVCAEYTKESPTSSS